VTQVPGTTGRQVDTAQRVVLVTGASGAGRTTGIAALEDQGYEVIDNLPLSLVPRLLLGPPMGRPVALGIDVRNREFSASRLIELIDRLTREPALELEVLYLDCQSDELVRRYGETRRRHPLSPETDPAQGIAMELDLLAPIRVRADVFIDTTGMSPHELKAEIARWFALGEAPGLLISVSSFSYKRGIPRGLDMMFDCRFLANPHWVPDLRALDGRDAAVAAHVQADARYAEFLERVTGLLLFVLPAHLREGKSHLAIGFGCTGGQHRSVAIADAVAAALTKGRWHVATRHRELERRAAAAPAPTGKGLGQDV